MNAVLFSCDTLKNSCVNCKSNLSLRFPVPLQIPQTVFFVSTFTANLHCLLNSQEKKSSGFGEGKCLCSNHMWKLRELFVKLFHKVNIQHKLMEQLWGETISKIYKTKIERNTGWINFMTSILYEFNLNQTCTGLWRLTFLSNIYCYELWFGF